MSSFFGFGSKNSIAKRCQSDEVTRLRHRYKPYYHTFEKQKGSRVWLNGKEMILLASNDYLSLGRHPKVIEAGKRALDLWGSSTTGARLSNGSRSFHVELENQIAKFLKKEACHVSSAGYLSCMSAIQPFARREDLIVADKNIHSALWSGIGLTYARVERFAHNNIEDLSEILSFESKSTPKIIVFEGVYSMEGHLAPVPDIVKASKGHNCFLVMDDAHGFGVIGDQGRGTASHFNVTDEIDIICGSFSKSLSSTGGFVAGDRDTIEYLRSHSKQTIFSAALSPVQAACAGMSLEILQKEPEHLKKLWNNVEIYKKALKELNLDIWESETPAVPIVLGSRERAYRFWKKLKDEGIFTVMSIAPAVPPGKDLIRTAISAHHTENDIDYIIDAIKVAMKCL